MLRKSGNFSKSLNIVKPVLEPTCIKQSTALRDHCSDKTSLLK